MNKTKQAPLYIIAGANGSGKTTFANKFSIQNRLHFINADEIAKELDPANITRHKIKAGKIFFERLGTSLVLGASFVIETTLSGKYLIKYIHQAKELGYKVTLIYLFLEEPTINIGRVYNRVLNGGHYVSKEDIIRRFFRSKKLFCELYKQIVSSWSIYYNAGDVFEKIADNRAVFDDEKYNMFKEHTKCQ